MCFTDIVRTDIVLSGHVARVAQVWAAREEADDGGGTADEGSRRDRAYERGPPYPACGEDGGTVGGGRAFSAAACSGRLLPPVRSHCAQLQPTASHTAASSRIQLAASRSCAQLLLYAWPLFATDSRAALLPHDDACALCVCVCVLCVLGLLPVCWRLPQACARCSQSISRRRGFRMPHRRSIH